MLYLGHYIDKIEYQDLACHSNDILIYSRIKLSTNRVRYLHRKKRMYSNIYWKEIVISKWISLLKVTDVYKNSLTANLFRNTILSFLCNHLTRRIDFASNSLTICCVLKMANVWLSLHLLFHIFLNKYILVLLFLGLSVRK